MIAYSFPFFNPFSINFFPKITGLPVFNLPFFRLFSVFSRVEFSYSGNADINLLNFIPCSSSHDSILGQAEDPLKDPNSFCCRRSIDSVYSHSGNQWIINQAEQVAGIPASWPGYDLGVGASGPKVRQLQEQLARISRAYPAIPTITADGVYGSRTREAVEKFQSVFGLPVTGIVDYPTWYKISDIYVAVSRIAELV